MDKPFLIGTGIHDITGPAAELGMMGWSNFDQRTTGIHSRLYARTFIIAGQTTNQRIVMVIADLWSCTQAVKEEVVKRLRKIFDTSEYKSENILISGTHTHSGPGGYSHYPLYNLAILGFDKQNFQCIVNGIVESIRSAHINLAPGRIHLDKGDLKECGWNRSPIAFNNNPEDERRRYVSETDTEMVLLKFTREDGSVIGCLNWFPIHPTSLGEMNELISGDSKGYASYLLEREMQRKMPTNKTPFVAAFANSNCGDVSGNVKGGIPDGVNDFKRMKNFGFKQYTKANELLKLAQNEMVNKLDYRSTYIDMSNIEIDETGLRTYPAAIGISMLAGSTEDGKPPVGLTEGITKAGKMNTAKIRDLIYPVLNLLSTLVKDFNYPKKLSQSLQEGHGKKPVILAPGVAGPFPLTPEILPIQLFRIGDLLIAGIPGEITTMAGRRLRETLLKASQGEGITDVALTAYANAYAGYITTREEYDTQHYEGASTHFGPHTLLAFQQEFRKLAAALKNGTTVSTNIKPRNLAAEQKTLQTGVLFDTPPLPWINFGDIFKDAKDKYKPGETAEIIFWGAHPRNDLRTGKSFLEIEYKEGNSWKTVFTDNDPCTTYRWSRDFIANSKITITWEIPKNITPGIYRIIHEGNAKSISGRISEYRGISKTFKVVAV